ncbi:hypothetical protein OsI_15517 [Oryza sativa Indica Group]|uniref:Uncharacterized protein n=1 Tax=Oryza sativa subsp. indica TaxID=39946 RepID=A2XSC1_ORYSI|nr:hypothetical protein OsI_15517 [Oryza sativa Indica Group]
MAALPAAPRLDLHLDHHHRLLCLDHRRRAALQERGGRHARRQRQARRRLHESYGSTAADPDWRRHDGRSKRHRINGGIWMQRPGAERLTLEDSCRCLAFPLVNIDG